MALRSHVLTEEAFLKEYGKNKKVVDIAASLGVSPSSVSYWEQKLGLVPRRRSLKSADLKDAVLEHVVGRCVSYPDLIRDLGLERTGVLGGPGVSKALSELEREGLVGTYALAFNSNGAMFRFYDLFDPGKIRPCRLVYESGQEFLLGFKIASSFRDGLSDSERRSVYRKFFRALPPTAYYALKKYM